ncbi:proliferating cell nuclear antigen [Anaeramoeba ignava]|uniref:DNA sliding clamp PCNA n=1 Tax=Anaeramoeba ignava TaxID=1746090 RepID=A0A9Q0LA49_ANAIG|nr:proliferating cell nuclear antigen [Anaeramoeba ignava]
MFKAKLTNAQLFKKLIDAIKDLVVDCTLDCSKTGIEMQAMDQSHISLVSFELKASGFEVYECPKNLSLGIHIESFSKILKRVGNNTTITLKADQSSDSLGILLSNPEETIMSEFNMKLVNIIGDSFVVPDSKYAATIQMPAAEYQRICRDLAIMGETVKIIVDQGKITFSSTGEIGSVNSSLKQDNSIDGNSKIVIESDEKVEAGFTFKYLNFFAKAVPLCEIVRLNLSHNSPLVAEFEIPELGNIRYFLAPKFDNEPDEVDMDKEDDDN